jgi:translation elongation factor EF-Ts
MLSVRHLKLVGILLSLIIMPVKSKAQNRFMHAAAANPKMARKLGIKQDVAQEFVDSEHGKSLKGLPEKVKK